MKCLKKASLFILFCFTIFSGFGQIHKYNEALKFNELPKRWDEALPLGNGLMGALIWEKNENMRVSLDHAKLWDQRPMAELHTEGFNYKWVKQQVDNDNYPAVQKIGDIPYEREPAPTKLPGAAIEFNSKSWGKVISATLDIENAKAFVSWENGIKMQSFVHATKSIGYFRFENCKNLDLELLAPTYQKNKIENEKTNNNDLRKLGYSQGEITKNGKNFNYIQKGWGGFYYNVAVKYLPINATTIDIIWSISTHYPSKPQQTAQQILDKAPAYPTLNQEHKTWWQNYWVKSSISIPDTVLERQYYLEMYKFGSAARANTPPISLQAVWTADNGQIPPWKGDFHHDLNTQLSYWPAYASNHLDEAMGYINHLESNKATYKKYTKWYFGTDGLDVPGVTTLDGVEMGGWIQYSLSPTVSSWLAHHYYLQWRYSMDRVFLEKKAFPWFKEVAKHLEQLTYLDGSSNRQLPISSSPEINDNSKEAWFKENTNYDLALMRFVFSKAAELANELNLTVEAKHYLKIYSQFSAYHLSDNEELKFSKNQPYNQSHRHFSHLLAIHPLGEIRWENGEKDQKLIKNSLELLDKIGPKNWTGYSYAWEANLKARAKDGEGAQKALYDFATAFCSINSFHLNGDQSKTRKSAMTYRPFTLEGNFAFAAGVQDMLLQSYAGIIEVFPAIPISWENISFANLRAEGAFLVSAKKLEGQVTEVEIKAEKGGVAKLKLPFKTQYIGHKNGASIISQNSEHIVLKFEKGGKLIIKNGYE